MTVRFARSSFILCLLNTLLPSALKSGRLISSPSTYKLSTCSLRTRPWSCGNRSCMLLNFGEKMSPATGWSGTSVAWEEEPVLLAWGNTSKTETHHRHARWAQLPVWPATQHTTTPPPHKSLRSVCVRPRRPPCGSRGGGRASPAANPRPAAVNCRRRTPWRTPWHQRELASGSPGSVATRSASPLPPPHMLLQDSAEQAKHMSMRATLCVSVSHCERARMRACVWLCVHVLALRKCVQARGRACVRVLCV